MRWHTYEYTRTELVDKNSTKTDDNASQVNGTEHEWAHCVGTWRHIYRAEVEARAQKPGAQVMNAMYKRGDDTMQHDRQPETAKTGDLKLHQSLSDHAARNLKIKCKASAGVKEGVVLGTSKCGAVYAKYNSNIWSRKKTEKSMIVGSNGLETGR